MATGRGYLAHRRARPAAASDGGRCSVQNASRSARGSASASTHPARWKMPILAEQLHNCSVEGVWGLQNSSRLLHFQQAAVCDPGSGARRVTVGTRQTCVGCQPHEHGQRQDRRLRLVRRLLPRHCLRRRLQRPSRHRHLVQPPAQANLGASHRALLIKALNLSSHPCTSRRRPRLGQATGIASTARLAGEHLQGRSTTSRSGARAGRLAMSMASRGCPSTACCSACSAAARCCRRRCSCSLPPSSDDSAAAAWPLTLPLMYMTRPCSGVAGSCHSCCCRL